jgi:hypothetical protein
MSSKGGKSSVNASDEIDGVDDWSDALLSQIATVVGVIVSARERETKRPFMRG